MIIEIEALDTLFFRDGKPFEKGDDAWATGMFPPLPSVIYGALRSAYLGQNDIDLDEVEEVTKGLKVKNIWYKVVALNDKKRKTGLYYLPLPLDLVRDKDLTKKQKKKAEKYKIHEAFKLINSEAVMITSKVNTVSISSHLTSIHDVKNFEKGLITHTQYEDYLKGKNNLHVREVSDYYDNESKIGIARSNATKTTSEGNLYRVGMLRIDKIKIYIEFEGLNLKPQGLLKLGGETKLATYKELTDNSDNIHLDLKDLQLGQLREFKICLTTPAIFKNGITPDQIFKTAKIEVELITCSVGKSLSIGGFNMQKTKEAQRGPKVMYKAVPAGSVYYYKLLSGNLNDLEEAIKKHNISEVRSEEGFGIAYIGKI